MISGTVKAGRVVRAGAVWDRDREEGGRVTGQYDRIRQAMDLCLRDNNTVLKV